jgi:hypothetical protein
LGVRVTERMATIMGDVIWVLAVIAFWMSVGVLVVVLIRSMAHSHDEEVAHELSERSEPVSAHTDDKLATT